MNPRDASSAAIDERLAIADLLDLLSVEGTSGREGRVARLVRKKLLEAGCRPSWIGHDDARRRLGPGHEVGNLVVRIPASPSARRLARRMFVAHLDTVPLCRGARPVRRGGRIVAAGETALGADDRTGVACLVTLARALLRARLERPPLTLLFTVAEETGLRGSSAVRPERLGNPAMAFNFDSGPPAGLVFAAVGADRWEVEVSGISAHAGVHPERGVSAALIASRAIARAAEEGWFGRIERDGRRGASNVGRIEGGEATNQVMDRLLVRGETRSHDRRFLARATSAWRRAFERAAAGVRSADGRRGEIRFRAARAYEPFRLPARSPVLRLASERARALGLRPVRVVADGGLDANSLNRAGIPTVTLGAGQHRAHTLQEHADLAEHLDGCRLAVALGRG